MGVQTCAFRISEGGMVGAAIKISMEEDDLAAIGELEIGVAGPAHCQRTGITRRKPAGRYELRRMAGRIPRPRRKCRVEVDGFAFFGARIEKGARKRNSCGQHGGSRDEPCERAPGHGFLHYLSSMMILYP